MHAHGVKEGIILVADDNEANCDLLLGLLGGEGYHVLSVTDGKQALERNSRDPIDLEQRILQSEEPHGTGRLRPRRAGKAKRHFPFRTLWWKF
jgi:DNA-binding response OmpR family regulator